LHKNKLRNGICDMLATTAAVLYTNIALTCPGDPHTGVNEF
jgi:hypothetical protein